MSTQSGPTPCNTTPVGPTGYGYTGYTRYSGYTGVGINGRSSIFYMDETTNPDIIVYKKLYQEGEQHIADLNNQFKKDERINDLFNQVKELTNEMEELERIVEKKRLGVTIIQQSILSEKEQFFRDNPFPLSKVLAELESKIIKNYNLTTQTNTPSYYPPIHPKQKLPIKNKIKELWQKIMK